MDSSTTELESQKLQPEFGDSADNDSVRQSAPASDRVNDKPQEAQEEA